VPDENARLIRPRFMAAWEPVADDENPQKTFPPATARAAARFNPLVMDGHGNGLPDSIQPNK